jgi:hypothetical protein
MRKLEQRPEIVKLLDAIKCLNRMVQFSIQDLQDISSIGKKKFKVCMSRVSPREALREVINSYKMQAHKKKQAIISMVDDSVPKFIETDSKRLQ